MVDCQLEAQEVVRLSVLGFFTAQVLVVLAASRQRGWLWVDGGSIMAWSICMASGDAVAIVENLNDAGSVVGVIPVAERLSSRALDF